MNGFGNNLRKLRNARNLSQYTLAHELGVAQTHIAGLEVGRVKPSWQFAQKVAIFFGVTLNDLAASEPEPTSSTVLELA